MYLIPKKYSLEIARLHEVPVGSHFTKKAIQTACLKHHCQQCENYISVLSLVIPTNKNNTHKIERIREQTRVRVQRHREKLQNQKKAGETTDQIATKDKKPLDNSSVNPFIIIPDPEAELGKTDEFPPDPLSTQTTHKIIRSMCQKMAPDLLEESGCAVCGLLTIKKQLLSLESISSHLSVLSSPAVSRTEHFSKADPISEFEHVLDHTCKYVCISCQSLVARGKVPKNCLAKGLWIGPIPQELACLRFVEKLLVARVRHSSCAITIASGARKMKANAIAFQSPTMKIYDMLPPPRSDMEEVLAILFTGPCKPTKEDLARTPFLIRRNKVKRALEWLILNHIDYVNIKISAQNLLEYQEHMPPVSVEYKESSTNKILEGTSVFENGEEDGTEFGECSFTVHGITGDDLPTMSTNAIKAHALHHLNSGQKILAVGHSNTPESIWDNPQLYPQMFPWLFPYGLGGIGSVIGLSDSEHK